MDIKIIRSSRRSISLSVSNSGEIIIKAPRYFPESDIELFVQHHSKWIEKQRDIIKSRNLKYPEPNESQRLLLIQKAKDELPQRTAYYANIMGLSPSGIKITGARTRFGSCSYKNSICYSWRLMQYPSAAIDYVIVHELAHIVHKNHSKDFYSLIASILPDYKERRELLKG